MSVCLYAYIYNICMLVSEGVRWMQQILWNCSYRQLWTIWRGCWESNMDPLKEQPVLSMAELLFQLYSPYTLLSLRIYTLQASFIPTFFKKGFPTILPLPNHFHFRIPSVCCWCLLLMCHGVFFFQNFLKGCLWVFDIFKSFYHCSGHIMTHSIAAFFFVNSSPRPNTSLQARKSLRRQVLLCTVPWTQDSNFFLYNNLKPVQTSWWSQCVDF